MRSFIIGTGACLPKKVVTNDDLSKIVDTSDEWIKKRTGISERHIVEAGETTASLATEAARQAIAEAKIDASLIDLIIVGTVTPDYIFPSVAALVQKNLEISIVTAFDVSAACSGFLYALELADMYIRTEKCNNALVIGADTFSNIIDWKDRSTCVLFGDGAGAVVLSNGKDQDSGDNEKGILYSTMLTHGQFSDCLKTTGGIALTKTVGVVQMEGKEVFKHAIDHMESALNIAISKAGVNVEDIDLFIPHQANARIISMLAERMNIPQERIVLTVDRHANTSAASIPLALHSVKDSLKGKLIAMVAMGAGITYGATIVRM